MLNEMKPRLVTPEVLMQQGTELVDLVHKLGQPRILVLGDLMLDRYVWGDAERISQEAPVILLRAERREERLGGASSVATMLKAIGASVQIAGVVGKDANGEQLRSMLIEQGIDPETVLVDSERPTTVKERYIGKAQHRHPQQIIRVDYEVRDHLSKHLETRLAELIKRNINDFDLVLVSDYDKGVCTPGLLASVISDCKALGKKVVVDPIRGSDYRKYHGVSTMTPNRLEAGLATGRVIETNEDGLAAAALLRERLDMEAAIITLDKEGMALSHQDGRSDIFPTRIRQVYDITGAGDMVLAVLGMALAAGADYPEAIKLANIAGGLEVEKIGVVPVTKAEMIEDICKSSLATKGDNLSGIEKMMGRDSLLRELEQHRKLGRKIVFTNGCFDVLHAGHVQYLREARAQGDILIVGLNSDSSVQMLKGPTRPVNKIDARSVVIAGLECVSYLAIFEEKTPIDLIRFLKPDVLVKGADYQKDEVVGGQFVESYGGRVHLASLRKGFSTTGILERLGAA